MDIHSWLANTADREPPDQPEHHGFAHLQAEQLGKKPRPKRERASSDSSLLQPRHHNRAKAAHRTISSGGLRDASHGFAQHDRQHSEGSARSGRDEAPPKTYERRARHKTRPDRYEPKHRKHHRERESRQEGNMESKPRKSHRSGDGGRTAGLVQSFQLKNGPQKSRLTLKPETNAGLFKHGRASAQVAGRGAGLPDLVFNEMRFLSKPDDHQDVPSAEPKRATGKRDSKRQREEEISAYFAHDRYAVADPRDIGNKPDSTSAAQQQRSRTAKRKPAIEPPVELPEKPFLGFGSKGQHVESRPTAPTSYYSWSESVAPEPQAEQAKKPRAANAANGRRMRAAREPGSTDDPNDAIENLRQPATLDRQKSALASPKRGKWVRSQRATGPAVEIFKPPNKIKHRRARRSVTRTTLHSVPHDLPSEPPLPAGQPQPKRLLLDSPAFHTSDILLFHHQAGPATAADARHSHDTLDTVDQLRLREKENRDPETSTPTSKLLRQAEQAVVAHQSDYPAEPSLVRRPYGESLDTREMPRPLEDKPSRWARSINTESYPRLLERRLRSASGLPLHNAKHAVRNDIVQPSRGHAAPSITARSAVPAMFDQEDEMLDQAQASPYAGQHVYANAEQAEALATAVTSGEAFGLYEDRVLYADQVEDVLFEESPSRVPSGLLATHASPTHDLSPRQEFRSDLSTYFVGGGHDLTADGELIGFWKPNRLY